MSMVKPPPAQFHDERTIGQLVADINTEVTGLVRAEVALAKAELKADAKRGGIGAGLLAGAAVFGLVGFVLLCVTIGFALEALGLSQLVSFAIVTLALFVIAGICALIAKGRLQQISGPKQAIDTTKASIETVKVAAKHNG